ncbi:DUF7014 domain-containing protein [Shewanella spartinae]|uniref:DUF7014 domain-containing protein n=2 Tax=Shewanella TaxID=22 RepID=UPI001C65D1BF|nr:hypothetical protein [Shewanella spartinae]QYJ92778.1 hypothetical protein K0I31_14300 [Shewanella spartinae]
MFEELFNVFSRRQLSDSEPKLTPLTRTFRNRLIMLLRDHLQSRFGEFLGQLHTKIGYLHGEFQLSNARMLQPDDTLQFVLNCKDEELFDVIELIFKSNLPGITWPDNPLIEGINDFFRVDKLPYHLTGYTLEEFQSSLYGTPTMATRIGSYPQIIRKDSEALHKTAIEPALTLLKGKEFHQANTEFLNALEDFRKQDFGDCLTKCCSSFESVMKVLCMRKSVAYKQTDTASTLLKALMGGSNLDSFWEQPLILIATLRNRLSTSHGGGTQSKIVSENIAMYSINATAAAMLLLNDEFK